MNPAAVAQPVEDVQGDGRWNSQVGDISVHMFKSCGVFYV